MNGSAFTVRLKRATVSGAFHYFYGSHSYF
jgi:hypothetical protein